MTKENKGLLTAVLIMVPTLWLTADAVSKIWDGEGPILSAIITVFLLVNFLLAYLCAKERTVKNVSFLFITYILVTFCSTILITIIAFFIGLKTGAIKLGKIGG